MSGKEDHARRVATFPEDVRVAHRHSSNHRAEIEASVVSGCFFCPQTYRPSEISAWTDADSAGNGQTAICPRCGVDSVLGDKVGYPLTTEFLSRVKAYWFDEGPR